MILEYLNNLKYPAPLTNLMKSKESFDFDVGNSHIKHDNKLRDPSIFGEQNAIIVIFRNSAMKSF